MPTNVALDDAQMAKLLAVIKALAPADWWQLRGLLSAMPVIGTAAVGFAFAFFLEWLKGRREAKKAVRERLEAELKLLNWVDTAIGSNITVLIHWIHQQIIPHYEASVDASTFLNALDGSPKSMRQWEAALDSTYQPVITRCPELVLEDTPFFRELPFLLAHDPELLVRSSWIGVYARHLQTAIVARNTMIEKVTVDAPEDGLSFLAVKQYVRNQLGVGRNEVINAHSLITTMRDINIRVETIIKGPYQEVKGQHWGLNLPLVYAPTMAKLDTLLHSFGIEFPPPEPPPS